MFNRLKKIYFCSKNSIRHYMQKMYNISNNSNDSRSSCQPVYEWVCLTCVHDAVEQSDTHAQRPLCSPSAVLPTVAKSQCAAPYWVACHDGSFNYVVRRAGTHGTCHLTLQSWGGSFSKWPLSICLKCKCLVGTFFRLFASAVKIRGWKHQEHGGETGKQRVTPPWAPTHHPNLKGYIVSTFWFVAAGVFLLLVCGRDSVFVSVWA